MHTSKRVIVADDTAFVREKFAKALAGAGHTAVPVRSAAELMARLREGGERIDLIVVDLRMADSGGVEMVRALRRLDEERRVPLLVFSGTITSADEVRDLAALGVAGYVNEYSASEKILPALAPHLFPDSFNRRSSPRVLLNIPITYTHGNTIASVVTGNISKGGVAIRTMTPLAEGTRIRTRFKLPDTSQDIETESRVAWSDRRMGMGLQFEKVSGQGQAAIDTFVDKHFFSNRRA